MELHHIESAIQHNEQGNMVYGYKSGEPLLRAFLYNRKWYPVKVIINEALRRSGELAVDEKEINTNYCTSHLSMVLPYARIKEIDFNGGSTPIALTNDDILAEIRLMNEVMSSLLE